jgi:hypothetical protein
MFKEMPVIPFNKVVDKKILIGKRRAKEKESQKDLRPANPIPDN